MPIMQIVLDENDVWHTPHCDHYDMSKSKDLRTIGGPDYPPQPAEEDCCTECLLAFKKDRT